MLGTLSAALMFFMQIVALPVYLKMIAKKGKAFTYRFGSVLWVLGGLAILLVQPECPDWQIYVLAAVLGFGISAPGLVPHTMFGDVADVVELVDGQREEGSISGIVNFLNKVVQGFGLAGVMAILGLFGFQESSYVTDAVTGVTTQLVVTRQAASAQQAIRWVIALAPLVLMSLGSLISTRYRVDAQKQHEIVSLLKGEAADTSARQALVAEFTDKP